MKPVTISPKYQVVIPREIREKYNLRPGQKIMFVPYRNTLRVILIPPIEEARGFVKGLNTDDFREEIDEER